jgi:hypothetical protein
MTTNITVADGKYTILQDGSGRLSVLRFGDKWITGPNIPGSNLILAMAYEIEELRESVWDAFDQVLFELNSVDTAGKSGDEVKKELYGLVMNLRPREVNPRTDIAQKLVIDYLLDEQPGRSARLIKAIREQFNND